MKRSQLVAVSFGTGVISLLGGGMAGLGFMRQGAVNAVLGVSLLVLGLVSLCLLSMFPMEVQDDSAARKQDGGSNADDQKRL